MLIQRELAEAINEQVGHEFGAHMQYLSIAAHFRRERLMLLSKLFFEQAAEEREHAMKLLNYLLDTQAEVAIPAIPAPKPGFGSAEEAVQAALSWEEEVTGQINGLMAIAVKHDDFMAQSFLQWFVDEQLEEINKMSQLLSTVRRAGEKNLIMVEAYLAHLNKG